MSGNQEGIGEWHREHRPLSKMKETTGIFSHQASLCSQSRHKLLSERNERNIFRGNWPSVESDFKKVPNNLLGRPRSEFLEPLSIATPKKLPTAAPTLAPIVYDMKMKKSDIVNKFLQYLPIVAAAIYLGKATFFFHQNPNFLLFWDWPGHLEKASVADWPWKGGWDNTFWAGYPTWVYPNFYHLLLKGTIFLTRSEFQGAMILTLAVIALQIHSVWFVISRMPKKLSLEFRTALFLATVSIMAHAPGSLLGSLRGTLFTGGGPAALATSELLYLIGGSWWPMRAMLLGLLFVTHPLTAAVALLYLFFSFVWSFRRMDVQNIKPLIFTLLWGIIIGLPWILSKLDPSFATTAINLSGNHNVSSLLLIGVLVLFMIEWKPVFSPLGLTVVSVGLFSLMPEWVTRLVGEAGIRGIHFFRFQWYLLLLWPLSVSNFLASHVAFRLKPITIPIFLTLFLLLILTGSQPYLNLTVKRDFQDIRGISGRVMDASRHSESLAIPQAMEHELAKRTNVVGSTRWIYESGSKGIMFFGLKNALEPLSFKDGTMLSMFEDSKGKPLQDLDIKETADLLGVNYVAYTELVAPNKEELASGRLLSLGSVTAPWANGGDVTAHYLLKKISDAPLVLSLGRLPEVNPDLNVGEWWFQTNHKTLYTTEPFTAPADLDLSQPPIDLLLISPTSLSLRIRSDRPTPVFVKFGYSPYWSARATNAGSIAAAPIWITPGYLFLIAKGDITLTWTTPFYLRVFSPVSVAALAAMCALTVFGANRNRS